MRASHCGGFSCCGAQTLGTRASVVAARGLCSCGAWASLLRGMWDLPRLGLEPVSPALAGGFLTTAPPGKPNIQGFVWTNSLISLGQTPRRGITGSFANCLTFEELPECFPNPAVLTVFCRLPGGLGADCSHQRFFPRVSGSSVVLMLRVGSPVSGTTGLQGCPVLDRACSISRPRPCLSNMSSMDIYYSVLGKLEDIIKNGRRLFSSFALKNKILGKRSHIVILFTNVQNGQIHRNREWISVVRGWGGDWGASDNGVMGCSGTR